MTRCSTEASDAVQEAVSVEYLYEKYSGGRKLPDYPIAALTYQHCMIRTVEEEEFAIDLTTDNWYGNEGTIQLGKGI